MSKQLPFRHITNNDYPTAEFQQWLEDMTIIADGLKEFAEVDGDTVRLSADGLAQGLTKKVIEILSTKTITRDSDGLIESITGTDESGNPAASMSVTRDGNGQVTQTVRQDQVTTVTQDVSYDGDSVDQIVANIEIGGLF